VKDTRARMASEIVQLMVSFEWHGVIKA